MASLSPTHLFLLLITVCNLLLVHSDIYIVHMDQSAKPDSFSDHHTWYESTLSSLSSSSSDDSNSPSLIYSYTNAIGGFSASLSDSQLQALENSPGVISWTRDAPVKPHTTKTPKFLGLNYDSGAWPISNYGKNVIIGVIDSGVWPESESYKDHGMSQIPSKWKGKCVEDVSFNPKSCNKKLIGARFYNKGLLANKPDLKITVSSVRDTEGHGTSTSSVAAGNSVKGASFFDYVNGTASGIAPHAHLAIYKVMWDDSASTSDVLAGIDQAIADGVEVLSISMSLGMNELYNDPIAIATFSAVAKGIIVAISAGNSGPKYYSVENGAPWLLTVGAGSIDRSPSGTLKLGNGVSIVGVALYPLYSTIFRVPLVFLDECDDDKKLVKNYGNIVVCVSEGFSLGNQISTLERNKVLTAILITSSPRVEIHLPTSFAALFLTPQQGQVLRNYIKTSKKPIAINLDFHQTRLGKKPAPIVGDYSSRGPSRSNPAVLKPDLIAPGTLILSAWPNKTSVASFDSELYSPFNVVSGTSTACPHVAGVAALLKSVHPHWSPAAIRSAMMTTANPLDNTLKPIKDAASLTLADPLVMGSGHVHPNKALDPGLVYDAHVDDYTKLLCSLGYTKKQVMTVTRSSSVDCSKASSDVNYPSFLAFFNGSLSSKGEVVQTFHRTVTNVGGAATYIAKLTPIAGVKVSVVPSKLVFNKMYEKLSFSVTVKGPKRLDEMVAHGSLSWIEIGGKHVVRSPIVATRINSRDFDD